MQIFQLSNYVHLKQYKAGKIILENGPSSDKLYLIKSGNVQIKIGDVILQTLEPGKTFGDFANFEKITKKANFIASTSKVECYYIEKENYEDINIKEILSPLKKYLTINEDKQNKIHLKQLYYIKDLGSGSYGKVYLVHDQKNFYAMKTANILQMNEMKESAKIYINEKNIMFSIKHPFIISIITTFKTKDFLFFLLEYIDGISLRYYMMNNPKRELRNLNEAKFFLGTMALVLNYLQKQKIIHRDLKPENIMIDYNGYLKVIDFGIAIDITGKDYTSSTIGTFHYMAPEVIKGYNYNNSVDYWSVGIIAYELFYGRLPFAQGENNPLNIYREILEKKLYLPSESEIGFNEVVKSLLQKNFKKRLNNFSQWKNYKLFNGFDFDKLLGLKMKGFYKINKSLNNEDLKNKKISFIDFGVAIDITGKDYACSSIGTFHYMAPEVIRGNNYNNAVDYWSVGIIAYELFYGRLPFGNGENNPLNIFREILKKKLYLPSENEIGFNEVVKDLLEKNPKKRLNNFSQWKNYKLFNGFDFDGLLGLKMKGFFMVNKSLNNEDLNNKDISFIEYMKNKDESDITQKNKENELLEDF